MIGQKKKILFIGHDATRTGGPIILLNFLEWLINKDKFEITVYLKKTGPLQSRFENLVTTYIPKKTNRVQRFVNRNLTKIIKPANKYGLPSSLIKQRFDLVYLNTVVTLDMAPYLKALFNCPIICHIHENEFTINYYYPGFINDANALAVDRFIAISKSTKNSLTTIFRVAADKIGLVYSFIATNKIRSFSKEKKELKQELGLTDEFIVGGCGVANWRKGVDIFMELAVYLKSFGADKKIKLIWVGDLDHQFTSQFNYESKRLGIESSIIFTGVVNEPQNYFQLFDVFALTSREEPFGMVAMEAAALNIPVLCFENAGGMSELIENGKNGIIVNYASASQMSEKILELCDNAVLRKEIGLEAGILAQKFDVEISGEQILEIIDKVITR